MRMVYFFIENKCKKVIKIKTVNATKNSIQVREKFSLNCKARNLVNDIRINNKKVLYNLID